VKNLKPASLVPKKTSKGVNTGEKKNQGKGQGPEDGIERGGETHQEKHQVSRDTARRGGFGKKPPFKESTKKNLKGGCEWGP